MAVVSHPGSEKALVEAPGQLGELALIRRIGNRTWLARTEDNTLVVARMLMRLSVPSTDMAQASSAVVEGARGLAALNADWLVPVLGLGVNRDRLWLVSELDRGATLRRFLEVAKPSAAQALLLSADVLRGAELLHTRGRAHSRLHANNVHISRGGKARLGDWAVADLVASPAERGQADRAGIAAVVTGLRKASGRPRGNPTPEAECLAELERQLNTGAGHEDWAGLVEKGEAAIGGKHRLLDLRAELAALLTALRAGDDNSAIAAAPPADDRAARLPEQEAAPLSRQPDGEGTGTEPVRRRSVVHRSVSARLWRLVAALCVLGGLIAIEFTFLHKQLDRDVRALKPPSTTAVAIRPAPNAGRQRPVPGPVNAPTGPIVAVDVRALRPCEPSAVCIVRVLVQVRPHHLPLSVAWKFDLVNRCSGSSVNQPGATTVVPPGAAEAVGLESLALPAARSLVVTAVTNAPSRTTSPALLVPAVGGSC